MLTPIPYNLDPQKYLNDDKGSIRCGVGMEGMVGREMLNEKKQLVRVRAVSAVIDDYSTLR